MFKAVYKKLVWAILIIYDVYIYDIVKNVKIFHWK